MNGKFWGVISGRYELLRSAGLERFSADRLAILGLGDQVAPGLGLSTAGPGDRGLIRGLRATKRATPVTVGVSTILFQTVAANRVLTPSIMGLDALYVLLQPPLVLALGGAGHAGLPPGPRFPAKIAVMTALARLLFGTLLPQAARDLPRRILTGVILGCCSDPLGISGEDHGPQ